MESSLETPRNGGWRRRFGGLPKIEGLVEGVLESIFFA